MGPHAGESEAEIFKRKIEDIKNAGITFWLIRSIQAKPDSVQSICKRADSENKIVHCIFIESASKGGAIPTKTADPAISYSANCITWNNFPSKLTPVTGKIARNSCALVFKHLELIDAKTINLWNYANFLKQEEPLKFIIGGSTVCAIKKHMGNYPNRVKSPNRKIIAVGWLCEPYGVWLK